MAVDVLMLIDHVGLKKNCHKQRNSLYTINNVEKSQILLQSKNKSLILHTKIYCTQMANRFIKNNKLREVTIKGYKSIAFDNPVTRMKAKVIHVLCEGQTEQGFVEEVLRPYLQDRGITGVKSILITTNKKKNARGGMLTYNDAERDIKLLRLTKQDNEYECHLFTTMFDLYALPDDFPGFSEASTIYDAYVRVKA